MRPGIFAKTFAGGSLEQALDGVVESGVRAIQFNLALLGGPSLPPEIPEPAAERVRESLRVRALELAAVSGTYNMAHPDPGRRRRGQRALATLIAAAPALGTRVVTLCTGTRDPDDSWRWHPDNASSEAWDDMRGSLSLALETAEAHDVVLAFEPEHGNVVADAAAARRLLDELASPRLRVLLDPANLVRPGQLDRQRETLEQAFELLADDLALAHAKDVLDDGTVVPAGRGGLDYGRYVALLRQAGYEDALVLHGLEPPDVPASVAFLERQLQAVGVG